MMYIKFLEQALTSFVLIKSLGLMDMLCGVLSLLEISGYIISIPSEQYSLTLHKQHVCAFCE